MKKRVYSFEELQRFAEKALEESGLTVEDLHKYLEEYRKSINEEKDK